MSVIPASRLSRSDLSRLSKNTVPIAMALKQGRICDAFCLVRAVLQQYNPTSPYVAIEDWDGVRCHDCDASVDRDDLCCCGQCGRDVCPNCYSCCDLCKEAHCRGCLEEDPVSHCCCCPSCCHTCEACGRTVDADNFVDDTDLCPECEAKRLEEEEAESAQLNPEEIDHDNPDESDSESDRESHLEESHSSPDQVQVPSAATLAPRGTGDLLLELLTAGVVEAPTVPARR